MRQPDTENTNNTEDHSKKGQLVLFLMSPSDKVKKK